jgi:uncharacterized membrane protein
LERSNLLLAVTAHLLLAVTAHLLLAVAAHLRSTFVDSESLCRIYFEFAGMILFWGILGIQLWLIWSRRAGTLP